MKLKDTKDETSNFLPHVQRTTIVKLQNCAELKKTLVCNYSKQFITKINTTLKQIINKSIKQSNNYINVPSDKGVLESRQYLVFFQLDHLRGNKSILCLISTVKPESNQNKPIII